MLKWLKQYWHPQSITFWGGVFSLAVAFAQIAGFTHPAWGHLAQTITILTGGTVTASPAQLIATGLGLLGIRAKLGELQQLQQSQQQVPK